MIYNIEEERGYTSKSDELRWNGSVVELPREVWKTESVLMSQPTHQALQLTTAPTKLQIDNLEIMGISSV